MKQFKSCYTAFYCLISFLSKFFFIISARLKRPLLICKGEMAEWSKAHAWKVCIPQKGIVGSNPTLSAQCLLSLETDKTKLFYNQILKLNSKDRL
jgi:hypothetical protein